MIITETDRSCSSVPSIVFGGAIDPTAVPFDVRSAQRFLKLRRTSPRFEAFDAMIAECLGICRRIIEPRFQYRLLDVTRAETNDETVELQGGFSFASRGLANALCDADRAAFFALTLGEELDAQLRRSSEEDFTSAYVLDGVASALLHGVLAMLMQALTAESSDLSVGKRFAPGFHNWDLSQQKHLFNILDPEAIGIELSDSYTMTPRHSITGVFALVSPTLDVEPASASQIRFLKSSNEHHGPIQRTARIGHHRGSEPHS